MADYNLSDLASGIMQRQIAGRAAPVSAGPVPTAAARAARIGGNGAAIAAVAALGAGSYFGIGKLLDQVPRNESGAYRYALEPWIAIGGGLAAFGALMTGIIGNFESKSKLRSPATAIATALTGAALAVFADGVVQGGF